MSPATPARLGRTLHPLTPDEAAALDTLQTALTAYTVVAGRAYVHFLALAATPVAVGGATAPALWPADLWARAGLTAAMLIQYCSLIRTTYDADSLSVDQPLVQNVRGFLRRRHRKLGVGRAAYAEWTTLPADLHTELTTALAAVEAALAPFLSR